MKVLCVGKVCLDVISYMDGYPLEDTDQSIPFQRWAQGGNAANNCVVLNQLKSAFGEKANNFEFELFGSFGADLASNFVRDLLRDDHGVRLERCPVRGTRAGLASDWINSIELAGDLPVAAQGACKSGLLSTSCVVVNRMNGSRTIVHARNDVSDVTFEDFVKADFEFDDYDWINFETRKADETKRMVDRVLSHRRRSGDGRKPIVSVEIEKNKKGSESLLASGVDYLFVSKDFARSRHCDSMQEAVIHLSSAIDVKKTTVVCPWSDQGACALADGYDQPITCPAYQPERAVDTLGAGDTFIASFIFATCQLQKSAGEALRFSCLAAGLKCSMVGYDGLGDAVMNALKDQGDAPRLC